MTELHQNPLRAAQALLAFVDKDHEDQELRFDGALLISSFLTDLHIMRRGIFG